MIFANFFYIPIIITSSIIYTIPFIFSLIGLSKIYSFQHIVGKVPDIANYMVLLQSIATCKLIVIKDFIMTSWLIKNIISLFTYIQTISISSVIDSINTFNFIVIKDFIMTSWLIKNIISLFTYIQKNFFYK